MMPKFLFALAALSAAATPTLAEVPSDRLTRSIEVRTDDLNLASPEAQRTLERRILYAARQICRASGRTLAEQADAQKCFDGAMRAARTEVAALIGKARARS